MHFALLLCFIINMENQRPVKRGSIKTRCETIKRKLDDINCCHEDNGFFFIRFFPHKHGIQYDTHSNGIGKKFEKGITREILSFQR